MPETAFAELGRSPIPYAYEQLGELAVGVENAAEGLESTEIIVQTLEDEGHDLSFVHHAIRAYGDGEGGPDDVVEFQEFALNEPGKSEFTARIITREQDFKEGPAGKFVTLRHATGIRDTREVRTATLPISDGDDIPSGEAFAKGFRVTHTENDETVEIADPSAGVVMTANLIHVLGICIQQRAKELAIQAEEARSVRVYD